MKHFCHITVKCKEDISYVPQEPLANDAFEAMVRCVDSDGNTWEMKSTAATPGNAAALAWHNYIMQPESEWVQHGSIVNRKKQKRSRWRNYDDFGELG